MAHLAQERQIRGIYENIESGSVKLALEQLSKVFKKQKPVLPVYKGLKAYALALAEKDEDDAHALCDELLALKSDDATVIAITGKALEALGRLYDVALLYEDAYKNCKDAHAAVELGEQAFGAHVKFGYWKGAHQLANKLYKSTMDSRHAYWAAMTAVLQSTDPTTPAPMRPVVLKVALRIIELCPHPSWIHSERLVLHVQILAGLGRLDDALNLLDSPEGRALCNEDFRTALLVKAGRWKQRAEGAKTKIYDHAGTGPGWDTILALIDGVVPENDDPSFVPERTPDSEVAARECVFVFEELARRAELGAIVAEMQAVEEADQDREVRFFTNTPSAAQKQARLMAWRISMRAALHGMLKLQARLDPLGITVIKRSTVLTRCIKHLANMTSGFDEMVKFIEAVIARDGEEAIREVEEAVGNIPELTDSPEAASWTKAKLKLERALLRPEDVTEGKELARALKYAEMYAKAMDLEEPSSEFPTNMPDDFALLSAQAFVNAWKISGNPAHILPAVCILERASACSEGVSSFRDHLLILYRLLGCGASLSVGHYLKIGPAVHPGPGGTDVFAHLVLSRASTFAFAEPGNSVEDLDEPGLLAGGGAVRMMQMCAEASLVYELQGNQVSSELVTAFKQEKYGQIGTYISFETLTDNTLQRDLSAFEHARMALLWTDLPSGPTLESFEAELIEMKLILDREHNDNRGFESLVNLQPLRGETFEAQTTLGPPRSPAVGWLRAFVKLYLRALATPELLHRELPSAALFAKLGATQPVNPVPLEERIRQMSDEERKELTQDEKDLVAFVDAVLAWIPGAEESASADEVEGIAKSFEDGVTRCEELLKNERALAWEELHAATTLYEGYVLFNMVLTRHFGANAPPAKKGGKAQKKAPRVPPAASTLKSRLQSAIRRLPDALLERAKREDAVAMAQQCKVLEGIVHIPSVMNRLAEARRLAFEGLARGIAAATA